MKYTTVVFLIFMAGKSLSQNNTSPYSIVGVGDIEKSSFDRTTGMGYAGVAMHASKSIYNINPASYSYLDDYFFHVETSLRYKGISYSGNPVTSSITNQSADLVSKKLVVAMKLKSNWGFSAGLLPYSTANYSFSALKTVQGTGFSTSAAYEGSGSLNQAYVANGIKLGKSLSLGIQASYLFGQQQQEETISSDLSAGTLYTKRNIYLSSGFFTAGIQYNKNVSKKINISFGAVASNKATLNATYDLLVKDGTNTIEENENYKKSYFKIPVSFTTGLAVTYNNKFTLAADYNHQDWNSIKYSGINYTLVNSDRLSVGLQYSKKQSTVNGAFERAFLQTGFFYNSSYLKIYGEQLKDYGVTFGGGLHAKRSGLGMQATVEFGQRGTTNNGLIKEKYTQFTLSLLYREFWFTKGRKYD